MSQRRAQAEVTAGRNSCEAGFRRRGPILEEPKIRRERQASATVESYWRSKHKN